MTMIVLLSVCEVRSLHQLRENRARDGKRDTGLSSFGLELSDSNSEEEVEVWCWMMVNLVRDELSTLVFQVCFFLLILAMELNKKKITPYLLSFYLILKVFVVFFFFC